MQVLGPQHPRAQSVDQGVSGVGGVEHGLAAYVGQPERVAVAADSADHAVEHPAGVRRVRGPEAQLVHHRNRARAHRHDVADDAADPGRGTLVRLDVGGMVVALYLEGDGPTVADVDDTGVLPDPGEHACPHLVGRGLAEVAQVHLRRLVGAVFAPHHRVHREFGIRRPAAEDLPDAQVLVVLESEFLVGLGGVGRGGGGGNRVDLQSHSSDSSGHPRREAWSDLAMRPTRLMSPG